MSGTDTDTTRDSSLLATSSTLTTSIMTGTTAAALVSLGTTFDSAQQFNGAEDARALAPAPTTTTTTSGAAMGVWDLDIGMDS